MICPQCGYERTKHDDNFVSIEECPRCGIFYKKWKPIESSVENSKPVVTDRLAQAERIDHNENNNRFRKIIFTFVSVVSLYCFILLFGLPLFGLFFSSLSGSSSFQMPKWSMDFYLIAFYLLPLAALLGLVFGIIGISIKRNSHKKAIVIMACCLSLYFIYMLISSIATKGANQATDVNTQVYALTKSIYSSLGISIWALHLFIFPFKLMPFAVLGGVVYGISEIGRKKDRSLTDKNISEGIPTDAAPKQDKTGINWALIIVCFIPVILIIMFLRILFSWRP
jgi:Zn-finger nucleic acid-binding protein